MNIAEVLQKATRDEAVEDLREAAERALKSLYMQPAENALIIIQLKAALEKLERAL